MLGLFLCTVFTATWGQEFGVFGKVKDRDGRPISYANIIIEKSSDSSFVAGTSTDDFGNFLIVPLASDDYIISISFIGFKSFQKSLKLSGDLDLGTVVLEESSETLDEINIIAKKPTVERKPDRLTFNIENTALTEGSTLQVLKSTPGVIVSNGSINVKSSEAVVYINNKRVRLSSNELMQLLEGTPANAIKSVEVITNPPASYDADSGVVVNVVMSKNLIAGYRGNVSANYTQGVYPRYNVGTSHFFKSDKLSVNVSYNFNHQKINRDNLSVVNYLDDNNEIEDIWTSNINRTTRSQTHNLNLNLDYEFDERNVISLSSTGLYTPYFDYNIFNNTDITDPDGEFLSRFTADNNSRDDKYNIGTDLDYKHTFLNGSTLRLNTHFTAYDYQRDQNVFSEFFDMDNAFISDSEFNTLANQETDIVTAGADYNVSINEDAGSVDAGIKFSNVQTDSDITKVDIIDGNPVLDPLNSDVFKYDEKVFAAYFNYTNTWNKWDVTLGLRAEQTNVEGESVSLNETNTQDYFEWFPNLSLNYNVTDAFSLYVTYNRSIERPNYTNLNPFRFFLNENTVVTGNPGLQPTFTNHFVLGTSFLENFIIEAYYINKDGAIHELPRQNNDTNIIAYVPANLDKTVDFGFDFWVFYDITDWWNGYAVTSFFNITEETSFNDGLVSLNQWSNYTELVNNFSLLEDNSLNIYFSVTYGSTNLQGLALVDTRIISDLSISKTILNDKGALSLSISDLFNEQDYFTTVEYLNQSSSNFTNLDNRFIKLGFRYNFGNTKLVTNQRSSSKDERKRLD